MKKNNLTTFIAISGLVIFTVFVTVAVINLMPNHESNSFYVKVNDKMDAKVEGLEIKEGKLIIETSGDAIQVCVKSTVSTPTLNSLCWNNIENNKMEVAIFEHKKYYVWLKDTNNNVSSPLSINTKEN